MAAGFRSPLPILGLAAGTVAPSPAAVRSMLAPWVGGASVGVAPTTSTGPRSMLAFWMGGAVAGIAEEGRARSRWWQVDVPAGRPRHYRRLWEPVPMPLRPAPQEQQQDTRIRRPARSSAHPSDGYDERPDSLTAAGDFVLPGLSTLSGGLRALDDEEALILALLMADD